MSVSGRERCRRPDVVTYSNYQLVSEKAFGKGWGFLGDAYGFVDAVLSPGVFMALESASLFDTHVIKGKRNKKKEINYAGLERYSKDISQWHESCGTVIDYIYNGRLSGLFEAGQNVSKNTSKYSLLRLIEWHIRRVIACMVSGAATRSKYNQEILYYSCRHFLSIYIDSTRYKMKPFLRKSHLSSQENLCLN